MSGRGPSREEVVRELRFFAGLFVLGLALCFAIVSCYRAGRPPAPAPVPVEDGGAEPPRWGR